MVGSEQELEGTSISGVSKARDTERDVEVTAKAQRRRFSAEYKRQMLREAEACRRPGEVSALLRREGLYSSHLAAWRAARQRGELAALGSTRRGPKPERPDPRQKRIAELERENRRLHARAERAEALVEVQKKLAELLGLGLPVSDGPR
jgi:transposase-like protein